MQHLSNQPGQFHFAYSSALEASGKPPRETVERLILDMVQANHEQRDVSPPPPELWAIFSFVREALRARCIPLNWLLGAPLGNLYDPHGTFHIKKGPPDAPPELTYLFQNEKVHFQNNVPNIPPLPRDVVFAIQVACFQSFLERRRRAYPGRSLHVDDISSFTIVITDIEYGNPSVYHATFVVDFSHGDNISGEIVFSFS